MKNPNGYGTIVKLHGNRRRPYATKITFVTLDTITNTYVRKSKYLGYYETHEEALTALAKHNIGNIPESIVDLTFKEVWDIWAKRNLEKGSSSRASAYTTAIKKWAPIYNKRMTDIKLMHLQDIIDEYEGQSKSALNNMKLVANFVFEWSIKNDLITKNYVEFLDLNPKDVTNHVPLSHEEFNRAVNLPLSETSALINIYLRCGCRPSELLTLPLEDVHLNERYFELKRAKTKAGIRIVPIAEKAVPSFEYLTRNAGTFLTDIDYQDYRTQFNNLVPGHVPHDTRATFISFMQEKEVPLPIIQKIVGHVSGNITTDVYTKISLEPMLKAVNNL